MPGYVRSHVHHSVLDRQRGEFALIPTFRLPVMIHTRSGEREVARRDRAHEPALDPSERRLAARAWRRETS